MQHILGLVGSERKLGNGEILVKAAAAACGEPFMLELIRLTELNLQPCRGCYTCLIPGKRCPIQDDLYFLTDKIKTADAIILAAPCYALGPAAITKLFTDRIIAVAQLLDEFWGKPCTIIGTYGIPGWEGNSLSVLTAGMRFMGFAVKDSALFLGALPGECLEMPGAVERINKLGAALLGEPRQAEAGQCPTCWSDVWRFPQPGKVVCPFCGQQGELSAGPAGVTWVFGPSGARFKRDQLQEHFHKWLKGKMEEYMLRRKELAVIRNQYKGMDTWLKPDAQ
ncbi:MAG: flavodoxin family protein [Peptococcaceae bacterium]|nr:flavodoxin family protein [Peptococcaceae bacterium]